jgi:hypothetical protein
MRFRYPGHSERWIGEWVVARAVLDVKFDGAAEDTRDAIASTKENELLGQTGDEFELALLLTRTEALSYASH